MDATAGTPSSSESSFCEEEDRGDGISPGGGHGYRLECNSTARAYRKHFLGKVSVRVVMLILLCIQLGKSVIMSDLKSLFSHTLFFTLMHPGAHELLLHWQQHRKPHHVSETWGGWGAGVPTHHAQVQWQRCTASKILIPGFLCVKLYDLDEKTLHPCVGIHPFL